MSRVVDEYVASMEFDNSKFERNVQTSMSTLDKLKQSLNLTGASKGLEDVSNAARRFDMSPMANAVEKVGLKFSALYTIADQELRNIVNRVEASAKRIVSAFTIDPIKSGLQEYETQIGAVQTILANTSSKGSTLDDVNGALDELNKYADKTIYNFTEMTRNIGTFTAAGVDLDKSVTSIKGIANLAAVSGSTSQQASTAMYQLSQALASGTIRLQDWNSVVNAGMGGEVFQTALKRTATQMGYNVDEMIKKYGSFRESLTRGEWLTADVLTETLTQLSGAYSEADLIAKGYTKQQAKEIVELANTAEGAATDVKTFTQLMDTLKESAQSGWTQTWELLIGDFEKAKKLWSGASKFLGGIIEESSEKRNNLLGGALNSNWDKMTDKLQEQGVGVNQLEDAIKKAAKEYGYDVDKIIKESGSLEEAFQDGALSVDVLKKALGNLKGVSGEFGLDKITKTLKNGARGEDVKKVENALKSLGYSLVGKDGIDYSGDGYFGTLTRDAIKDFQKKNNLKVTGIVDEETLKALDKATSKTVEFKESIDDLVSGITELGGRQKLIESLKNILGALGNITKPIKEAFSKMFPPMTAEQLFNMIDGFHQLTISFKEWTESEKGQAVIGKLTSAFKGLFSIVDIGWTFIKELAGGVWDLLGHFGGLATGVIGAAGSLGDWITGLRNTIKESGVFGTVIDGIVGFLGKVVDKVSLVFKFLKSKIAMPGFEGFLSLMKGIWTIITKVGSKVGEVLSNIGDALGGGSGGFSTLFDILNGGLLAGILLNVKKFTDGGESVFGGIRDILDSVKGCFEAWQKDIQAKTLLKIAAAVGILAASLLLIASIDEEKLTGALWAITTLFVDLVGSMALLNKIPGGIKGVTSMTVGMLGISTAVLILSAALKTISGLNWEDLAKGLVGVAGLMTIVVVAAKALGAGGKTVIKGAGQMLLVAGALKILASVCEDFGRMSWEGIGKGVAAIGALLLELGLFAKLTGNSKKVVSTGASLILIGAAMKIFAGAVKDFSGMEWDELGRGLVGMAAALAAVALAVNLMPRNMIGIGLGLIAVSGALLVLADALGRIGGMSWEELGKGLAGLGGSIVILAIGLNFMNGAVGGAAALLIAAGALAILTPVLKSLGAMKWSAIGKGLLTLAAAFAVIGVAGLLLGPIVPAILGLAAAFALIGVGTLALGAGLTAVGVGITALATAGAAGATSLVASLAVIIGGIADLIPTVATKLGEGVVAFCEAIADSADAIATCVMEVLASVLEALAEYTPQIVDSLFTFVIGLIDGIAARAPELVTSLLNLCTTLITSVIDALKGMDTTTLIETVEGIGLITAMIIGSNALSGLIPGAMTGILGVGAFVAELALVLAALGAINQIPGLDWLIDEGGVLLTNIGNAIGGFVGGIIGGIAEGFTASLPAIGTDLSTFMTNMSPFIEGAKQIDATMLDGVKNIASIILTLTAANLLEGLTSWATGESSLTKFGEELGPFGTALSGFATAVSGIDEAAVTAAANAGTMLTGMAASIPNSGGLISFFTGENSMATFATELVAFGTALASFSTAVSGIDETAVTTAANVGTMLASLATSIPNSGGLISFFTGDNTLDTFGTEIAKFGTGLKGFSDAVTGIDTVAVTAAADAGTKLSTLANSIPETGGLFSWFSGDNEMSTFGDQLKKFGKGIKGFSDEVVGLDIDACGKAAQAANSLSALATVLSTNSANVNSMPTYGGKIEAFGKNIKKYYDKIKDVNAVKLSSISTSLSTLASISADNSEALSSFMTSLGKVGTDGIKAFLNAFSDVDVKILEAGANMLKRLVAGAKSQSILLNHTFTTLSAGVITTLRSKYDVYKSAGSYLVDGFAAGISANTWKAKAKSKAMAEAAISAARVALDEHSPSRIGYEIGDFFGMPFVDAIGSWIPDAYSAGSELASSAKKGLSEAISRAQTALESGIDAQPTIRPVLDLSDIRAGASSIGGMFSMRPSVAAMANLGSISSSMNVRQNGGNGDVVSAIKDLGRKINNTPSNVTTIGNVTYDDGNNINNAVEALVRAARIERRT